jgi:hypothetical protein
VLSTTPCKDGELIVVMTSLPKDTPDVIEGWHPRTRTEAISVFACVVIESGTAVGIDGGGRQSGQRLAIAGLPLPLRAWKAWTR